MFHYWYIFGFSKFNFSVLCFCDRVWVWSAKLLDNHHGSQSGHDFGVGFAVWQLVDHSANNRLVGCFCRSISGHVLRQEKGENVNGWTIRLTIEKFGFLLKCENRAPSFLIELFLGTYIHTHFCCKMCTIFLRTSLFNIHSLYFYWTFTGCKQDFWWLNITRQFIVCKFEWLYCLVYNVVLHLHIALQVLLNLEIFCLPIKFLPVHT